jgi:hypothetical protein
MTDEECHCEIVFFVPEAVSLFRLLGGHCELVFTFAKQSLPLSPWGNAVEIRDCFASLAVTRKGLAVIEKGACSDREKNSQWRRKGAQWQGKELALTEWKYETASSLRSSQ